MVEWPALTIAVASLANLFRFKINPAVVPLGAGPARLGFS